MTTYGLYDTITTSEAERVIGLVYDNFKVTETLDFDDIESQWCTLTASIDNDAEDEYIIKSFTITLADQYFQHQNYYITVNYYDLQTGDLTDEYEYDTLKSREFQLASGTNTITLGTTPCYLQKIFKLTVKK